MRITGAGIPADRSGTGADKLQAGSGERMKRASLVMAALVLALAAPVGAVAGPHGENKGKHKGPHDRPPAAEHAPGKGERGRPEFSGPEQDQIVAYFRSHPEAREQLPPGLAKQNKIPPGWQKKLARGQRIPDDIWVHRVPLPRDIVIALPPPPAGVIHVRIHDRILRVVEKTHEVLDDFGLPHPPLPRSSPPR